MDCKEFREALDLYVDEELAPEDLAAARLHLSECRACTRAERELLRLRRALKLAALKHQPPPELVSAVNRITQPWWSELLRGKTAESRAENRLDDVSAFWRKQVALPAPVFLLLLLSVMALGLLYAHLRTTSSSQTALQNAPAIKRATSLPQSDDSFDFARFDGGGRASLYKERR